MRRPALCLLVVACALATVGGVACGRGEDRPRAITAGDGTNRTVVGTAGDEYEPVTDVAADTACGRTIVAVRRLLAAPGDEPVDWAEAERLWRMGDPAEGAPPLDRLVDVPEPAERVAGALASSSTPDAVRREIVDHGILVMLAVRVAEELEAAESGTGDAVHDIDQAWAYFTAGGAGLAALASQTEAYFGVTGRLGAPMIAALVAAQRAATVGDASGLAQSSVDALHLLSYVLALGVLRFSDHAGDQARRAAADTLYAGLAGNIEAASPLAHAEILAGIAGGEPQVIAATFGRRDIRPLFGMRRMPDQAG